MVPGSRRCSQGLWVSDGRSVSGAVSRGTIDDCELVEGLVLTQRVANSGVSRVEKAKIGLIQFCLSPPKTDVSPRGLLMGLLTS